MRTFTLLACVLFLINLIEAYSPCGRASDMEICETECTKTKTSRDCMSLFQRPPFIKRKIEQKDIDCFVDSEPAKARFSRMTLHYNVCAKSVEPHMEEKLSDTTNKECKKYEDANDPNSGGDGRFAGLHEGCMISQTGPLAKGKLVEDCHDYNARPQSVNVPRTADHQPFGRDYFVIFLGSHHSLHIYQRFCGAAPQPQAARFDYRNYYDLYLLNQYKKNRKMNKLIQKYNELDALVKYDEELQRNHDEAQY